MGGAKTCPDCGTELPADAPAGVCPKCLLKAGLQPSMEGVVDAADESAVEATVITGSQLPVDQPGLAPTQPSATQVAMTPSIGSTVQYFGDYELIDEIARGGMGVVYEARQVRLNRTVALKMILAGQFASDADVKRFHIEAEAAAQIDHPGIVPVFEVGEHDGHHFFSMGFIEGESLARRIADKPLAPKEAADIVRKIAEAVAYAHGHSVIHRDLKPANILIDKDGEPKITDFGLAKRTEGDSGMTASGQILGTPSYMPPEQAGGRIHDVRETADIYSIGAILYTALTGRPPFQADNPLDTLMQVLEREPVSSRQLNPNVPKDLETICHKCLDKHRRRRYQSAQELADELQRFLDGRPINARPLGRPARVWRWCRRNPVVSSLILLAICLLTGGTVVSTVFAIKATNERDRAEENAIAANEAKYEADEARDEATDARDEATAARDEAKQQELETRRRAYISDINLIQQSLALSKMGQARRLLYAQIPDPGEEDQRGWEWRYLWQLCRSQAEYQLVKEPDSIRTICISSDGKWAAYHSITDKVVSIRDLSAQREIRRISVLGQAHCSSPVAPLLALIPSDGPQRVLLWNVNEDAEVATLELKLKPKMMQFSGDGRFLIIYTGPEVIRWRVEDWQEVAPRTPSPGLWMRDGGQYAVNTEGNLAAYRMKSDVVLLDLEAGRMRWRRRASTNLISALAFSSDSTMLASAAAWSESSIRLWNVEDGVELGRLIGHRAWVSDLKFLPGEQKLISSSADRSIRLWDVTQPELPVTLLTLRGHEQEVWRMALSHDGRILVSGGKDGMVLVWDLDRVATTDARRILPRPSEYWSFSPDGESVVTVSRSGIVERWAGPDFGGSEVLFELGADAVVPLPQARTASTSVRFSKDGQLLAAYMASGKVVVWDIEQREIRHELKTGRVNADISLFIDDAEKLLISYRGKPDIHLWNLRTGAEEPLPNLRNFFFGAWVTPSDERWVLGVRRDGEGNLRDQDSGEVRELTLDASRISDGAISPDDSLFATSSNVGYLKLWETDTFTEVAHLRDYLLGVHSVTFSPDGTRLATGSAGFEAVKLRDVRSRRELLNLEGQGNLFHPVRFSSSGALLGASPVRGPVHIWRAPSWKEIAAAEAKTEAVQQD